MIIKKAYIILSNVINIIDNIYNYIILKIYKVNYGDNLKILGRIIIQGRGKRVIGSNVRMISKESINPIGGNKVVLQVLDNGEIVIGNNVGMSHAILCSRKKILIEDDVLLGGGVKCFDNDFHSLYYQNRIKSPDLDIRKGTIIIRKGAFIGAHSIILKNVVIGEYSVVGAGSVVTKDIPPYEVWAGNPARFIKKIGGLNESNIAN